MAVKINNLISSSLDFLSKEQMPNGEFKSMCYLPTAEVPIWYYSGPSPFLTANIAYCLSFVKDDLAENMFDSSLDFLLSLKERFDLWRYWEHNSPIMEYNVPLDLDDTCLSSFLLKKRGIELNNKAIISDQFTSSGTIRTWFLPTSKHLKKNTQFLALLKEYWNTKYVFLPNHRLANYEAISSPKDSEPAVECHAILYLGLTIETESVIKNIEKEIVSGKLRLEYYDQPHFVFYHLSRLVDIGYTPPIEVSKSIQSYISMFTPESHNIHENYLVYICNLLTLIKFGWTNHPLYIELRTFIINDPMMSDNWQPLKYWTSKQRSWWAGSSALSCALYIEALSLLSDEHK